MFFWEYSYQLRSNFILVNHNMAQPLILDIETQHAFTEVGYDHKKLKVSVVGIFDYATNEYNAYFENELSRLFVKMEHASFIIGFNINKFDLPVLSPYYLGNIFQFPALDILDEVEKNLGFRVALDDLARATLGTKKLGHGLLAIEYFKRGNLEKLKNYCLDDVRITRQLYEYGKERGVLHFLTSKGIRNIKVSFKKEDKSKKSVTLSLPF